MQLFRAPPVCLSVCLAADQPINKPPTARCPASLHHLPSCPCSAVCAPPPTKFVRNCVQVQKQKCIISVAAAAAAKTEAILLGKIRRFYCVADGVRTVIHRPLAPSSTDTGPSLTLTLVVRTAARLFHEKRGRRNRRAIRAQPSRQTDRKGNTMRCSR